MKDAVTGRDFARLGPGADAPRETAEKPTLRFDQLIAQLAAPASGVADASHGQAGRRYGPSIREASKDRQWTPENIALLGTMADAQVAKRIGGISFITVQKKRQALGIPPATPASRPWTPEHIAMLGARSDAELARLTGRSTKAVNQKRIKLGIPSVCEQRSAGRHKWTLEHLSMLGTLPDKEVGARIGLSAYTVCIKRRSLRIRAAKPHDGWHNDDIALLGTMSDAQVAQRLGVKRHVVTRKRRVLGIPSTRARSCAASHR